MKEIPLKEFLAGESARLHLSPQAIYDRLRTHGRRYYPDIKLRQVNRRVLLVTVPGSAVAQPAPPTRAARRREQMRIGGWFLSHFPARMTQPQAAKHLGLHRSRIEQIEKLAAYQIVRRMRATLDTAEAETYQSPPSHSSHPLP